MNTAVQIRSPRISQQYSGLVKLSSTKILMHFTNFSDQKGTALIFTISGTAIAVGTECVFNSGTCYYITATVLASGNYVLIAYNDSDTTGKAQVLTISGTTVIAGIPITFNTGGPYSPVSALVSADKVMVAYCDAGSGRYVTVIYLTAVGTSVLTSIKTVIRPNQSDYTGIAVLTSALAVVSFAQSGSASYNIAMNFDTASKSTNKDTIKGVAKTSAIAGNMVSVYTL